MNATINAADPSEVVPGTTARLARGSTVIPILLLAVLVVLAAVVRVIATHNDLWLDELISLRIANAVKTPWQIFSNVHSDNNHYLNTLFLYFVKKQSCAPAYRWLCVLWGVLLVPAGYWLLVRRSRVEAVILAGLLACSYPLIHFSSEARGYSGALLGSVLACAALARWMTRTDRGRESFYLGLVYGLALVLAILSHLTACVIWFSLAAGSLITLAQRPDRTRWISRWIALNSPSREHSCCSLFFRSSVLNGTRRPADDGVACTRAFTGHGSRLACQGCCKCVDCGCTPDGSNCLAVGG